MLNHDGSDINVLRCPEVYGMGNAMFMFMQNVLYTKYCWHKEKHFLLVMVKADITS
jgi:hypothetical protein